MDEDTGLLRASVAYPFKGEAARTRLLFGAGLHFLAGVVAVGAAAAATVTFGSPELAPVWLAVGLAGLLAYVPLLGYTAGTIRELLDDEPAPTHFGNWERLLRDGRRFAVVALLYAAPLAALVGLAVFLGGSDDAATLAVVAAAGLYALVAAYVLPAAAVSVVNTGTTSAAWDAGTLRDAVVDHRYFGRWLLAGVVVAFGGTIGAALTPVVLGFVVLFAVQVAATYAVTQGVILSLDLTLEAPPPAPASGYVPDWDDGSRRKQLSAGRLGGSLLPTTPDGDEGDGPVGTDETPPTPGSLATTDDGGDTTTDIDRQGGQPDAGSGGSSSSGSAGGSSTNSSSSSEAEGAAGGDDSSDIEPYESDSGDADLATDDEN